MYSNWLKTGIMIETSTSLVLEENKSGSLARQGRLARLRRLRAARLRVPGRQFLATHSWEPLRPERL